MNLCAVLMNPPLTDGQRTRKRVELLLEILGGGSIIIVNLFPTATRSVLDIPRVEQSQQLWQATRLEIETSIELCDRVLLAYGLQAPRKPAASYYHEQVAWLQTIIAQLEKPTITVGGLPRHPSRWQRFTSAHYPTKNFRDALRHSIRESPS